tara:strand:+ start:378 stop:1145 length:768 start_codon:yes stop_codon:yes gene_type:complete
MQFDNTGQSSNFHPWNGFNDMVPDGQGGMYAIRSNSLFYIDAGGSESLFATGLLTNSYGLALDGIGNAYVANKTDSSLQKVDSSGSVSVFSSDPLLNEPFDLAFDSNGILYASNTNTDQILRFNSSGQATVFASGLDIPLGMVFDDQDNLFVVNNGSASVAKIDPDGTVSGFASTGSMTRPWDPALDNDGNLYVVSYWSTDILKLTPSGTPSVFTTIPTNTQAKFITIIPEPASLGLLTIMLFSCDSRRHMRSTT